MVSEVRCLRFPVNHFDRAKNLTGWDGKTIDENGDPTKDALIFFGIGGSAIGAE